MFPIRDHNPSGRRPFVTLALIALNIGIFLAYYPGASDGQLARTWMDWALIPGLITGGSHPWTLLTHMFLHGGWMHLAGNMLFLWIFGDNLEAEMGPLPYLGFYLLSGFAAAALQILAEPGSPVPMVGASGAIAGVMGGYLLLYPRARVDVLLILVIFFKIFTLPAWIVLGVWIGVQLFAGLAVQGDEGIAYFAHIGGFFAGIALALPLWWRLGARRLWARTAGQPPHPVARYPLGVSSVPRTGRRR